MLHAVLLSVSMILLLAVSLTAAALMINLELSEIKRKRTKSLNDQWS